MCINPPPSLTLLLSLSPCLTHTYVEQILSHHSFSLSLSPPSHTYVEQNRFSHLRMSLSYKAEVQAWALRLQKNN